MEIMLRELIAQHHKNLVAREPVLKDWNSELTTEIHELLQNENGIDVMKHQVAIDNAMGKELNINIFYL